MNKEDNVLVWTLQAPVAYEKIRSEGRYVVKSKYIEEKFKEAAWIFKEAYGFIGNKAAQIVAPGEGAESPVWIYKKADSIPKMPNMYLLKLSVPRSQVLFWDIRNWTKILNLSYLGIDREEEKEFNEQLQYQGVKDNTEIFSSSFYPLQKTKIKQSWGRLFDKQETDDLYVHGMVWEIKEVWLQEVIYIG